jgi:hypothetical protein
MPLRVRRSRQGSGAKWHLVELEDSWVAIAMACPSTLQPRALALPRLYSYTQRRRGMRM